VNVRLVVSLASAKPVVRQVIRSSGLWHVRDNSEVARQRRAVVRYSASQLPSVVVLRPMSAAGEYATNFSGPYSTDFRAISTGFRAIDGSESCVGQPTMSVAGPKLSKESP
jgi:hypothetical protein